MVIDPFGEETGLRVPRMEADILLVSHGHSDHSNKKAVKKGGSLREKPFLADGPGEYDIAGVFIKGIPAFHDDRGGKERGAVTIFSIKAEGLRLCHLSDLGQKELSSEQLDEIGEVDILMAPVGGKFSLSGKRAAEITSRLEPKIVIPMHYRLPKLKPKLDGPEEFLKAMAAKGVEPREKLLVKKKDLPSGDGPETVLLKP